MKRKLPFVVLGLGGLGFFAVLATPRRTPEAPKATRRTSPPPASPAPVVLDPALQEEMRSLPPAEVIVQKAAEKRLPLPPPAKDLTEKDLKAYLNEIVPLEKSADPATAALARQLHLRTFKDFRDRQEALKKQQMEERRAQMLKERQARIQTHEERRPPRRRDPNDRPTQPLVPPPQLGKPYIEQAEPAEEAPK